MRISSMLLSVFLFGYDSYALTSADLTRVDNILRRVVRRGSIPTVVRLTFHDCVGGCDGCLNINNTDNAGLQDIVANLDTLYINNNIASIMTRADFWAYAGYYALNKAVEIANDNCDEPDCEVPDLGLVFKYGREDCDTAPYTDVDVHLPSANLGYSDLISFFASRFGFTAEETIALMGAHTLGGAEVANSGFRGVWVTGEANDFNNAYYTLLADSGQSWSQRNVGTASEPRNQWKGADGFMLNADMCLYKEVQLDSDGASSCTYDSCASTPLATLVETYANSNDAWIPDFAAVFQKMVANGYESLNDLDG